MVEKKLVVVFKSAPADGARGVLRLHEDHQVVLEVDLGLLLVIVNLLPKPYMPKNIETIEFIVL